MLPRQAHTYADFNNERDYIGPPPVVGPAPLGEVVEVVQPPPYPRPAPVAVQPPPLPGSNNKTFFWNNTSYSGADMKVIVHSYGDNSIENEKTTYELEIANKQLEIEDLNERISLLSESRATKKTYSTEHRTLGIALSKVTKELADAKQGINSLEKELARLSKIQNKSTSTKVLAEIQTLSVSIARDKAEVRSFGSVYPKGFTRGGRTIAGTMVFTVFDEYVLRSITGPYANDISMINGYTTMLMDQLPPLDVTVAFANEYGSISRLAILGVEFVDDGQVMSIEDLITENTVTFVARDIDPIRRVGQRSLDEASIKAGLYSSKKASDLLEEEDYKKYKNNRSPYDRFYARRTPFI